MDNNVGTITLGTKVDTKGVDKGLVDIERKVTGKGFMNEFSRMFSGIFSKISSGASKITSSYNSKNIINRNNRNDYFGFKL